jgi:hypothetical protein
VSSGTDFSVHLGPLDLAVPGFDFRGEGMNGRALLFARMLFTRSVQRDPWSLAVAYRVASGVPIEIIGERFVDIFPETQVEGLERRMLRGEELLRLEVSQQISQGKTCVICHAPHWLVKPHEQTLLEQCKWEGIKQYPNG